jgi:hypothetical protein
MHKNNVWTTLARQAPTHSAGCHIQGWKGCLEEHLKQMAVREVKVNSALGGYCLCAALNRRTSGNFCCTGDNIYKAPRLVDAPRRRHV